MSQGGVASVELLISRDSVERTIGSCAQKSTGAAKKFSTRRRKGKCSLANGNETEGLCATEPGACKTNPVEGKSGWGQFQCQPQFASCLPAGYSDWLAADEAALRLHRQAHRAKVWRLGGGNCKTIE